MQKDVLLVEGQCVGFNNVGRTERLVTGDAPLTHRMGKSDPCETILTEEEFCSRLERLRRRIEKSERWFLGQKFPQPSVSLNGRSESGLHRRRMQC
jgi:hypothetical protein